MAKSKRGTNKANSPEFGTLLRAENGDVINYDPTGLSLRLSDKVLIDIQRRLTTISDTKPASVSPSVQGQWLNPEILGDIDAWDLKLDGDWFVFSARLRGEQGTRQFRRLVEQGEAENHIIADASGPLFGLLSIGGARRAGASDESPRYPYHVISAGDDIGAVGVAGVENASKTSTLQQLPEQTRDSLIAETILDTRFQEFRALPLIIARTETDSSASIVDLADGKAFENFLIAAENLNLAASSLNKRARLFAVGIDYTLEDVKSDETTFRNGFLALMKKIEGSLGNLGFRKPLFIATFDSGTRGISDTPVLRGQWELAWQSGEHDLVYSSPSYMFEQTDYGRPTDNARREMAEMDAAAIDAIGRNETWTCPVFLLAEHQGDSAVICARAQGIGALVIDESDPLNAGKNCGFSLAGVTNGAEIQSVKRSDEDPQDILVTCSKRPEGTDLQLLYGFGLAPSNDTFPAARGSIRDAWEMTSRTGRKLHRWALPCALPIH